MTIDEILKQAKYKFSAIERVGIGITVWLSSDAGVTDATLTTRFRDTEYSCIGYGTNMQRGTFIRLVERSAAKTKTLSGEAERY